MSKRHPLRSIYLLEECKNNLSIVRHSVNKVPCILIHWTASIFQYVITFRKFHHVQIIEVASIFGDFAHATGILDNDEHVHVVANNSRHDTTQLGHSLLIVH